MDNKKLAKLIDKIVEIRLKRILKSDQFNQLIKEQVSKEVIKLLVEINLKPNKVVSTKKPTTHLTDLLKEKQNVNYPRLPNKTVTRTYSKNPSLNALLNQTARDKVGLSRLDSSGNPLVDMQGGIDPRTLEGNSIGSVTSELANLGISPGRISNLEEITGDVNIPMDLTKEDMLSEGLDQIDINQVAEVAGVDDRYGHLVNAFTRDYSEVLNLVDEKVKSKRPMLISTLQPGIPVKL
jgi:hypothetical protein